MVFCSPLGLQMLKFGARRHHPSTLRKADFDRLFERGVRTRGARISLLTAPGTGRWGIATSKKVGCHARRNRLKRRLRAAVSEEWGTFRPDLDYILSGGLEADRASLGDLRAELQSLLRRAHDRWENELGSP